MKTSEPHNRFISSRAKQIQSKVFHTTLTIISPPEPYHSMKKKNYNNNSEDPYTCRNKQTRKNLATNTDLSPEPQNNIKKIKTQQCNRLISSRASQGTVWKGDQP